jgi:myo-inositol-1(or 4)-monophosphatase
MYQQIIDKIKDLGNQAAEVAGKVADIGEKKTWLTEWDIKIENELSGLIKTFPGEHSLFAEEINDTYQDTEHVWIIDPISSTFNFIYGLPHFAIVVSHLYQGEVVFAAVYDPSSKEFFTAEKGKGAYLNGDMITVSSRENEFAFLMSGIPSSKSPYYEDVLKILSLISKLGTVRTLGSLGVHYAYVACGRVDAAISKNKDTFPEFAGKLLVEEAGGKFTDFEGGDLTVTTHGILATNGKIHEQIISNLKML